MSKKLEDLSNLTLINNTILLDVSHVKMQGDDLYEGGILLGKVQQSEVPTYGYVVAVSEGAIDRFSIGDIVPIATPGILRQFDWPGKPKNHRIVSVRVDAVDGCLQL